MSYTLLCYKKRLNFYPNQRLSLPENILHWMYFFFLSRLKSLQQVSVRAWTVPEDAQLTPDSDMDHL